MKRLIVIATKEELPLTDSFRGDGTPILITGVGALNVIRAMRDIPRETEIINVGYVGSPDIPIGTTVTIGRCDLFHKVEYDEPFYRIAAHRDSVCCHTITDFGGDPNEIGCVYDMELAFILALGFENIMSYKTVSDNLSYEEYTNTINENGKDLSH